LGPLRLLNLTVVILTIQVGPWIASFWENHELGPSGAQCAR
jgi:hypothetical protein